MSAWVKVCKTEDILENGGSCVRVGERQIAIFNFDSRREWYAVQNMCPHKQQNVLSRGLIGAEQMEPKIACPLHKNTFSLRTGRHLGGHEEWQLKTYPVKVEKEDIYIMIDERDPGDVTSHS